ncbi:MAG: hypothetical protein WCX32_04315, partial [Clostridia bacterium]
MNKKVSVFKKYKAFSVILKIFIGFIGVSAITVGSLYFAGVFDIPVVEMESVSLSSENLILSGDSTQSLTVYLNPAQAEQRKLKYTVETNNSAYPDNYAISVPTEGMSGEPIQITPRKDINGVNLGGIARIIITDEGNTFTEYCVVTVDIEVTDISILTQNTLTDNNNLFVYEGTDITLDNITYPTLANNRQLKPYGNTSKIVKYNLVNTLSSVATLTGTTITALSPGTITVKASTKAFLIDPIDTVETTLTILVKELPVTSINAVPEPNPLETDLYETATYTLTGTTDTFGVKLMQTISSVIPYSNAMYNSIRLVASEDATRLLNIEETAIVGVRAWNITALSESNPTDEIYFYFTFTTNTDVLLSTDNVAFSINVVGVSGISITTGATGTLPLDIEYLGNEVVFRDCYELRQSYVDYVDEQGLTQDQNVIITSAESEKIPSYTKIFYKVKDNYSQQMIVADTGDGYLYGNMITTLSRDSNFDRISIVAKIVKTNIEGFPIDNTGQLIPFVKRVYFDENGLILLAVNYVNGILDLSGIILPDYNNFYDVYDTSKFVSAYVNATSPEVIITTTSILTKANILLNNNEVEGVYNIAAGETVDLTLDVNNNSALKDFINRGGTITVRCSNIVYVKFSDTTTDAITINSGSINASGVITPIEIYAVSISNANPEIDLIFNYPTYNNIKYTSAFYPTVTTESIYLKVVAPDFVLSISADGETGTYNMEHEVTEILEISANKPESLIAFFNIGGKIVLNITGEYGTFININTLEEFTEIELYNYAETQNIYIKALALGAFTVNASFYKFEMSYADASSNTLAVNITNAVNSAVVKIDDANSYIAEVGESVTVSLSATAENLVDISTGPLVAYFNAGGSFNITTSNSNISFNSLSAGETLVINSVADFADFTVNVLTQGETIITLTAVNAPLDRVFSSSTITLTILSAIEDIEFELAGDYDYSNYQIVYLEQNYAVSINSSQYNSLLNALNKGAILTLTSNTNEVLTLNGQANTYIINKDNIDDSINIVFMVAGEYVITLSLDNYFDSLSYEIGFSAVPVLTSLSYSIIQSGSIFSEYYSETDNAFDIYIKPADMSSLQKYFILGGSLNLIFTSDLNSFTINDISSSFVGDVNTLQLVIDTYEKSTQAVSIYSSTINTINAQIILVNAPAIYVSVGTATILNDFDAVYTLPLESTYIEFGNIVYNGSENTSSIEQGEMRNLSLVVNDTNALKAYYNAGGYLTLNFENGLLAYNSQVLSTIIFETYAELSDFILYKIQITGNTQGEEIVFVTFSRLTVLTNTLTIIVLPDLNSLKISLNDKTDRTVYDVDSDYINKLKIVPNESLTLEYYLNNGAILTAVISGDNFTLNGVDYTTTYNLNIDINTLNDDILLRVNSGSVVIDIELTKNLNIILLGVQNTLNSVTTTFADIIYLKGEEILPNSPNVYMYQATYELTFTLSSTNADMLDAYLNSNKTALITITKILGEDTVVLLSKVNGIAVANAYLFTTSDIYDSITILVSEPCSLSVAVSFTENATTNTLLVDMLGGIAGVEFHIVGSAIGEAYVIDILSTWSIIVDVHTYENNLRGYFNSGEELGASLSHTNVGSATLNDLEPNNFYIRTYEELLEPIALTGTLTGTIILQILYNNGVLFTFDIIVAEPLTQIILNNSISNGYAMPYNGQAELQFYSDENENNYSTQAFLNAGGQILVTIANPNGLEFTVNDNSYTAPFEYSNQIIINGTASIFTAGSLTLTLSYLNAPEYSLSDMVYYIIFSNLLTQEDIELNGMQSTAHIDEIITLDINNTENEDILMAYFNDAVNTNYALITMSGTGDFYINGIEVVSRQYQINTYDELKDILLKAKTVGTVDFDITFANLLFTIEYSINILELESVYASINGNIANQTDEYTYYSESGNSFTINFNTENTDALIYYLEQNGIVNVEFTGTAEFTINGVEYQVIDATLTKNLFTDLGVANFNDTLTFVLLSGIMDLNLALDLSIFDSNNIVIFNSLHLVCAEPLSSMNLILENTQNTDALLEVNQTANLIFNALQEDLLASLQAYFLADETVTITVDNGNIKFEDDIDYATSLIISTSEQFMSNIIYKSPATVPVSTIATLTIDYSDAEIADTQFIINIVEILNLSFTINDSISTYYLEKTKSVDLILIANNVQSLRAYYCNGGTLMITSTNASLLTVNNGISYVISTLADFTVSDIVTTSATLTLKGVALGVAYVQLSDVPRYSNTITVSIEDSLTAVNYLIGETTYLNESYYIDKDIDFDIKLLGNSNRLKAFFNSGYTLTAEFEPTNNETYLIKWDSTDDNVTLTFDSYDDLASAITFNGSTSGIINAVLTIHKGTTSTILNTLEINISILQNLEIEISGSTEYPNTAPYLYPLSEILTLDLTSTNSTATVEDYFVANGNKVIVIIETVLNGNAEVVLNGTITATELVGGQLPDIEINCISAGVIRVTLLFKNSSNETIENITTNLIYIDIMNHITELSTVTTLDLVNTNNGTLSIIAGTDNAQENELIAFFNAGGKIEVNVTKEANAQVFVLNYLEIYEETTKIAINSLNDLKNYTLKFFNTDYSETFTLTPALTVLPTSYALLGTVTNIVASSIIANEPITSLYFVDSENAQLLSKETWFISGGTSTFKLDLQSTVVSGFTANEYENLFEAGGYIKLYISGYDAENKYIAFTDINGNNPLGYFDIKLATDLEEIYICTYQKTVSNIRIQIAIYGENDQIRYVTDTSYCDIQVVTDILQTVNLSGDTTISKLVTNTYSIVPSASETSSGSALLTKYFNHGGSVSVTLSNFTGELTAS